MRARDDLLDLAALQLSSGEGRRLEVPVSLGELAFGQDRYDTAPDPAPAVLDISAMTGHGVALRLRFTAELHGPCMRCLQPATPSFAIDDRQVNVPGSEGDELQSPYVDAEDRLDVRAWAHDALVLALPQTITCTPECKGLCAVCGANLNDEPDHAHEREPDPRWDKLRELFPESGAA